MPITSLKAFELLRTCSQSCTKRCWETLEMKSVWLNLIIIEIAEVHGTISLRTKQKKIVFFFTLRKKILWLIFFHIFKALSTEENNCLCFTMLIESKKFHFQSFSHNFCKQESMCNSPLPSNKTSLRRSSSVLELKKVQKSFEIFFLSYFNVSTAAFFIVLSWWRVFSNIS